MDLEVIDISPSQRLESLQSTRTPFFCLQTNSIFFPKKCYLIVIWVIGSMPAVVSLSFSSPHPLLFNAGTGETNGSPFTFLQVLSIILYNCQMCTVTQHRHHNIVYIQIRQNSLLPPSFVAGYYFILLHCNFCGKPQHDHSIILRTCQYWPRRWIFSLPEIADRLEEESCMGFCRECSGPLSATDLFHCCLSERESVGKCEQVKVTG